jgi:hypothetical protein
MRTVRSTGGLPFGGHPLVVPLVALRPSRLTPLRFSAACFQVASLLGLRHLQRPDPRAVSVTMSALQGLKEPRSGSRCLQPPQPPWGLSDPHQVPVARSYAARHSLAGAL